MLLAATTGCFAQGDPSNPVGATLIEGRPAVVVTLCDGEGVESVFITDSASQNGEGPVLWRIEVGDRPIHRDTFVIGEVPEGFVVTRPLAGDVPRRELTAWVTTDSGVEMVNAIDFREVEDGGLYVDLDRVSQNGFRKARHCS
jgi:hypothetical protein